MEEHSTDNINEDGKNVNHLFSAIGGSGAGSGLKPGFCKNPIGGD
jgi:hypothetical protein